MTPLTRIWLRRIALGLPLLVAPAGAGIAVTLLGCGTCPGAPPPREHVLTEEQRARIVLSTGAVDYDACRRVCLEIEENLGDGGVSTGYASMYYQCVVIDADGGAGVLRCSEGAPSCGVGRAPAGLLACAPAALDATGRWLASCAHLEAASVLAFDDLARELTLHGAPRAMIAASQRSARDEQRHARSVAMLAARYGADVPAVQRAKTEPRSLLELALDDVAQGCVGEAYGAIVAAHQAESAADPFARAAFAQIARDEARHALLSDAVAEWAGDRLGAHSRARAEETRRAALDALRRELEIEPDPALAWNLGTPSAERAQSLLAVLG